MLKNAVRKNAVPSKPKAPLSDSSDVKTGGSDEGTKDEEQAEGGSGFESGSDENPDTTKRESAVKAAAPVSAAIYPSKRTRRSFGKEYEPAKKRKKPEVATPAARAAPKAVAQPSAKKRETKAERGKPTAEKKSAAKRKTSTPAPKTSVSSRSEHVTPPKSKSSSQPWSPDEELVLSRELQRDRCSNLYESSLPSSRADPYWDKLMGRLSFLDKYEEEHRIERLCEKIKRMRIRYESLIKRRRGGETSVYKNEHEATLWRIWHTIWGPHKATPGMLDGSVCEGDYEEEEDGSGPKGSEDDEGDIVPLQVKRHQPAVGRTSVRKKLTSNEVVFLDGTDSDESPVKATPPAVVAASAEISAAGKRGPALKFVSTKDPAVSARDVDSGKSTSRFALEKDAQGAHALTEMMEKSVRAMSVLEVSDEMPAENFALLRDARDTCVKMVEEAKAQTEKILEETRVKTTEFLEEARLKSSLIMEDLRLAIDRLGTFAEHSGETNGTLVGRLFSTGTGHLGSEGVDPNNVKWREQREAEQGLIIQRLQLVQEEARVQQEGILLKLDIQKQQALAQSKRA